MNIGENIKKYRKEKDITQEMLADRIGVTFQAISKWERGDSFPDITLLPALANYFGVTVDELLGCKEDSVEQDIQLILEKLAMFETHYQGDEMRRLVQKSIKKYPGDFRLMAWFVYAWNNVDPEKCIEIGEYVLKNCTQDEWRMFTKRNLIYAYQNSGNTDKAIKLAKELPGYYDTAQDVLTNLLDGEELKKHIQHKCMDLAYEFWYDIRKIMKFYPAEQQIELFKKSNAVYDAIYENNKMPVTLTRKMRNFQGMAEVSLKAGKMAEGFMYMTKAVECCELHDSLPEIVEVDSLLFNAHPYNRKWEYKENLILSEELAHDFETEDEFYGAIREKKEYVDLLNRLKS